MRMKSLYVIIAVSLAALFLASPVSGQYRDGRSYVDLNDSETVSALKKHVRILASDAMEGRKAGSPGEEAAADYLTQAFKDCDIDLLSGDHGDVFGMRMSNGDTIASRNVIGFIPGYDKQVRGEYIVIGARLDNLGTETMTVDGAQVEKIYNGANGNASGLAMLIELGRKLRTNSVLMRRSVLLMGFGDSRNMNAGSWYFLNRAFTDVDNIVAMVNLDMLGTGNSGFYAYTASNPDMNAIISSVNSTLQPIFPEVTTSEPYPSDHRSFYDKRIPSVYFTTGRYSEHDTPKDVENIIDYADMERELEYIYSFSIALASTDHAPAFDSTVASARAGGGAIPYYDCDRKPTFLGSPDPAKFLQTWVYHYLKYPDDAVRNGIQGRVLVDFVIDEKGKVTDVKVLKGVDPLLDNEAVRVINASPDWKPGTVRGKKVKSRMSLYVEFRLKERKK